MNSEEINEHEIVVTLLEDEKKYIARFYPITWVDYHCCLARLPICFWYFHDVTLVKSFKGFAMQYLYMHVIDAENSVFVKLCEIDKRLGVFNQDYILLAALFFFAVDLIQNNEYIKVWFF